MYTVTNCLRDVTPRCRH